jgi:hypothetical protein
MSSNWVVPSANTNLFLSVTSLNALTNDVTLQSLNNSIEITNPKGNDINLQVVHQTLSTDVVDTSELLETQDVNLSTIVFTNAYQTTSLVHACASFQTSANQQYNITAFLEIDGVKIHTADMITTIGGVGHYINMALGGSIVLEPGEHTLHLVAHTNALDETITCVSQNTNIMLYV